MRGQWSRLDSSTRPQQHLVFASKMSLECLRFDLLEVPEPSWNCGLLVAEHWIVVYMTRDCHKLAMFR
jgi:hypothetical protein